MRGWWRKRGSAEKFDLYVRWSFYANYISVPPLMALSVGNDVGPRAGLVVAGLLAVHTYLSIRLINAGLDYYVAGKPQPIRLMVFLGVLTAAGMAVAHVVYPNPTQGHSDGPATGISFALIGMYACALSAAVRPAVTTVVCAVGVLAAAALEPQAGPVIAFGLLLAVLVGVYRMTVWMLDMVWELDRSRTALAQLAVAEERLRFARDLHDVVGHNLSAVALKAELAAQLAKRGREEAVDEMLEVRRIAQDSLAEVRAVVSGYRSADLATELAGARSLLGSAGIACRVVGDSGGLPERVQSTLGWVVREGTTNVLRHSEAHECLITLRGQTLEMENDGAPGTPPRFGSGLTGLSERIAELGGTVSASALPPDRFRLTVSLGHE